MLAYGIHLRPIGNLLVNCHHHVAMANYKYTQVVLTLLVAKELGVFVKAYGCLLGFFKDYGS